MRNRNRSTEAADQVQDLYAIDAPVNRARGSRFTARLVISLFLVSVCGVAPSGCATVIRGGSEKLAIQSVPSGSEVKLSTGQSGVTPMETEVKRKDPISVTISKPGYKKFETTVISSIDGASLGIGTAANLLFLPVINDIVDYQVGANYSHKPNPLIAHLIPSDDGTSESSRKPESVSRQSGATQPSTSAAIRGRADATERRARPAEAQTPQDASAGSQSAPSASRDESRQPTPERLPAPEKKVYRSPADQGLGFDSL